MASRSRNPGRSVSAAGFRPGIQLPLFLLAVLIPVTGMTGTGVDRSGGPDLEARVASRTRVEKILYDHRLWPKENKSPKPNFNDILPATAVRVKVVDLLKKSAALDKFWNVRLSDADLDREVARMKANSRDKAMLEEMFSALNHDPVLIRETLARHTLTENLIHRLFDRDPRFHADELRWAERIRIGDAAAWETAPGRRFPEKLSRGNAALSDLSRPESAIETPVSPEEFDRYKFDARPGLLLPTAGDNNQYILRRVVNIEKNRIETETLLVTRRSFDDWWATIADLLQAEIQNSDRANALSRFAEPATTSAAICDQWSNPAGFANNPPVARYNHSAVWTGAEMIVWGGVWGGNSGGRYLPALDVWYPTSEGAGVPAGPGRDWFTAVWTGTEMIIWGGSYYTITRVYLNDGARYNPASDSWIQTPGGTGLPQPRHRHTAVWSGSEMVVWGGEYCNGFRCTPYDLASGGRLDPGSGIWRPTSVVGAPAPRSYHSAIWTGNAMVIWGGYGTAKLNSGGQYHADLDSWTPTAISNGTPSARNSHSAVWTGVAMIVWGGATNMLMNDGGRYDPISDQWWALSTLNAPQPRVNQTAIWSGQEMLIWGGSGDGGGLNSGSRYQPGNDSWRATSVNAGVPVARAYHTAIWDGSEMIVWGGSSAGTTLSDGGMYISGSAPSPANSLRGTKSSFINLTWPWITGAGSYNVKRSDLATGLFPYIPTTIVSTPTINQYSEPNDALSHFYAVEAVNQCGATP